MYKKKVQMLFIAGLLAASMAFSSPMGAMAAEEELEIEVEDFDSETDTEEEEENKLNAPTASSVSEGIAALSEESSRSDINSVYEDFLSLSYKDRLKVEGTDKLMELVEKEGISGNNNVPNVNGNQRSPDSETTKKGKEYTFSSDGKTALTMSVSYGVKEDGSSESPSLTLVSPDGIRTQLGSQTTKIQDDKKEITLHWASAYVQLDFASAAAGNWSLISSSDVTFTRMEYAGASSVVPQGEDGTENPNDMATIPEDDEDEKETKTENAGGGQLLLLFGFVGVLILMLVIMILLGKKKTGSKTEEKKEKKEKTLKRDNKIPVPNQDEELEQIRAEFMKEQRAYAEQKKKEEEEKQKRLESIKASEAAYYREKQNDDDLYGNVALNPGDLEEVVDDDDEVDISFGNSDDAPVVRMPKGFFD